jgi:putative flavoprotein involved in K+ transport
MTGSLPRRTETVVVGAGQAGLTMSWWLQQGGREHVLIDRRTTLGGGWQDRWDAFRLVSPNWTSSFPGYRYEGADPHGFMPRAEIAGRVRDYAAAIKAPVITATEVTRLSARPDGGFTLETSAGPIEATNVVVASGSFHTPRLPALAADLPKRLVQLHSSDYRSEASLPEGAVLVVGTGQSGVQLAEELHDAGRHVILSVGSAGRLPRRYRNFDTLGWLARIATRGEDVDAALPSVETLADPKLRFAGNPHLSGHRGGHETNLRQFAAEGMSLVGRMESVAGEKVRLAPDLERNLAFADGYFDSRFRGLIEDFIDHVGLDLPPDDRLPYEFAPPILDELDLAASGVNSVLWTSGYRMDYRWIDLPILDDMGYPRQTRGVTDIPGLYFLGLLWQHNQSSATLFGVNEDAHHLARQMGLPEPTTDWKLPIPD